MIKLLLPALLLASNAAFALLPPLAQSCIEIQAIMESKETYKFLGGATPIDQVVRVDGGYAVITAKKQILVEVEYIKGGKIGPARFVLHFHPAAE